MVNFACTTCCIAPTPELNPSTASSVPAHSRHFWQSVNGFPSTGPLVVLVFRTAVNYAAPRHAWGLRSGRRQAEVPKCLRTYLKWLGTATTLHLQIKIAEWSLGSKMGISFSPNQGRRQAGVPKCLRTCLKWLGTATKSHLQEVLGRQHAGTMPHALSITGAAWHELQVPLSNFMQISHP